MARHRSFSSEFKRQLAKEFLNGRAGLHGLARRYSLSRNLIRRWIRKYEAGELTDEAGRGGRRCTSLSTSARSLSSSAKVGQLTMEVDLLKQRTQLGG